MKEETKLGELTFGHILRLLREIAILFVLGFISIKLISGDLGLDFAKLSASELVSILLAFFSIALAAAFYFASIGQSNQFYDNVNKFSKDTSELLGRLDEQVKGIGGRQSELKDSIDRYYNGHNLSKTSAIQEITEKKTKEVQEDLSGILKEILDKTNLPAPERAEYEQKLKEKDLELSMLRERQGRISRRSESPLISYARRKIQILGLEKAIEMEPKELLLSIIMNGAMGFSRDLEEFGYTKTSRPKTIEDITNKGAEMISSQLEILIDETSESLLR